MRGIESRGHDWCRVGVVLRNGTMLDHEVFFALLDDFRGRLAAAPSLRDRLAILDEVEAAGIGYQSARDLRGAFYTGLSDEDALRCHLSWLMDSRPMGRVFAGQTPAGRSALALAFPVLLARFRAEAPHSSNRALRGEYARLFAAVASVSRRAEAVVWASLRTVPGYFGLMTCIDYLGIRPKDVENRPARMRAVSATVPGLRLTAAEAYVLHAEVEGMAASRRRADPFRKELEGLAFALQQHHGRDPGFTWRQGGVPQRPPVDAVPGLVDVANKVWASHAAGREPWWEHPDD